LLVIVELVSSLRRCVIPIYAQHYMSSTIDSSVISCRQPISVSLAIIGDPVFTGRYRQPSLIGPDLFVSKYSPALCLEFDRFDGILVVEQLS
jgi:hypothetical protein